MTRINTESQICDGENARAGKDIALRRKEILKQPLISNGIPTWHLKCEPRPQNA